MNLRIMTMADIPAGMRLKDIAGWNQLAVDWERFLEASPRGCFAAEMNGEVVGTATTIVYEGRFAWIGMVLVDPAHRGKGIGTALLERTIEYLDGAEIPAMKLDATPQGKPIYEKLGFVAEYEIERWVLNRAPDPSGGKSPSARPDLTEICTSDRQFFGADRSRLLLSLDQEAPEFTMEVRRSGALAGYCLGRRGSRANHLGPWMARDESAAGELLEGFLRLSVGKTVFVDAMKMNPFVLRLLRAHGFEFSRPLTRMYRGPNQHPGLPQWLCAILGPEFG